MEQNLANKIRWIVEEKYGGKVTAGTKKDIARLKAGEPLDYIIGFVDFLDCKIDLSKKVLIPRVETEFWASEAIEEIKNKEVLRRPAPQDKIFNSLKILDMFAGSGCIGVAVLKHVKNAQVTFVDSEQNCVEQIKINCRINKIDKKRYNIVRSNLFSNSQESENRFDYIFANPPYIAKRKETRNKIQESVIKFEPHAALFGGQDGLFYVRKFLTQAKDFLNPGGIVFMEFDTPQKPAIEKLLKKAGYQKYQFHKDQFDTWRYLSFSL